MASYAQQNKVTHAGVAVNNWAGDFECSVCRRKRLTASEFSKKMQERYKKDGNGALKCKICVDKAAADERAAAAAKTKAAAPSATTDTATCAACKENLPVSAFTKPQLKKGPAKQRCQPCIARAEADEQASGKAKNYCKLCGQLRSGHLCTGTPARAPPDRATAAAAAVMRALARGV